MDGEEEAREALTETSEAVSELVEEKREAEGEKEMLAAALENANERAERAEETAEAIAAAAVESERMREVSELREEIREWQNKQSEIWATINQMQEALSRLEGAIAGLATMEVLEQTASSSSIPQASVTEEAITETMAVLPETVQSVVDENPAPAEVARKRRRLI